MKKKDIIDILSIAIIIGLLAGIIITAYQVNINRYIQHGKFRLIFLLLQKYLNKSIVISSFFFVILATLVRIAKLLRKNFRVEIDFFSKDKNNLLNKIAGISIILIVILNGIIAIHNRAYISKNPHVIVIVIDAARADHLGCYGYHKNTSPHIDKVAEEGALFRKAVTVFPRTSPSAVSIVTGLYAHTHGTRSTFNPVNCRESPDNLNLAEILRNEMYITGGFTNHELLDKRSGLNHGITTYVNVETDSDVAKKAIEWLGKNKTKNKSVFLWLWYFGPHWPYNASPEDLQLFCPNSHSILEELLKRGRVGERRALSKIYSQKEIEILINAYDAKIYHTDKQIGKLIDYLKKSGLYENSIIVITADHGESLGEHDFYFEHGEYYYDVTALVPLIIKRPRQERGEVFDYQVRNIDIFPTILSTLKIDYVCEGENLFPTGEKKKEELKSLLAFGENDYSRMGNPRRYIDGTAGKWRIARSNNWKLIFIPHPGKNIFEFYDIKNDPLETNNLIDSRVHQEEIRFLKNKLFDWIKPQDLQTRDRVSEDQIDQATKERLKSLGYL